MIDTQFERDAVEEMADWLDEHYEQGEYNDTKLLQVIGEICSYHNIPPEDRVDFACEGLKLYIRRIEMQVVSDFREELEQMERFFK